MKASTDMTWYGADSYYRRRRRKQEWAGTGIGDAFRQDIGFYLRLSAQTMFYKAVRKAQEAAARQAGHEVEQGFKPNVKPQIAPFYTTYLSQIAGHAATGLTAYLEFQSWLSGEGRLEHALKGYIDAGAMAVGRNLDPKACTKVARDVTGTIQTRLLLADLARANDLDTIEIYRLFQASQQPMRFTTLKEIVDMVVMYGDCLAPADTSALHPLTRAIMGGVREASEIYLDLLPEMASDQLTDFGMEWVRDLCNCLARFMPPPRPPEPERGPAIPERWVSRLPGDCTLPARPGRPPRPAPDFEFGPLLGPQPPSIHDQDTASDRIARSATDLAQGANDQECLDGENPETRAIRNELSQLSDALDKASGKVTDFEDMRSDLVEETLADEGFEEGPVEGDPAEGHEVEVEMEGAEKQGGQLFDRPAEPSEDQEAYARLMDESRPVVEALRRNLYPNVEHTPLTERFQTSGVIDASRLACSSFSDAIYKRYRIREQPDIRGRPVLAIACDGSGSLSDRQMRMTKVLAAAWLASTARTQIKVIAGLYHSGEVRDNLSGTLVQWMYHERKTRAMSRIDGIRAVVSLPDCGTGCQKDAVSISYMLDEAVRIARGSIVYLILISDCEWNKCFSTPMTGKQEVHAVLDAARKRMGFKLHGTLVALGVEGATGFEDVMDKVIAVPDRDLEDPVNVAGRIGSYVATCMRERRRVALNKG